MSKLRELRLKNNMTQEELAKKINVARTTVTSWENEMSKPPLDKAIKIARILGTTVEELFDLSVAERR
ncbi:helix-turn-helix transcriptional regulator [Marinitoga sp. 1138]|uniref:helix-turn-helix transcriptional regulator n=1 Tax=Marinitoga sp. 1138 TaxID=1643334 RepID=UPI0015860697|nr:helix-turn-helix transcriptional regulator [Marinitoga sp. 1138]NUU96725.1 XRE family transcriptional regulator [Marinitoga sp. 1138]